MNPHIKIICYGGICISAFILITCLFFSDLVKSFAKDYINQRIEPSVTASATFTEDKVLPQLESMPELQEKIRNQINEYRTDPILYINNITDAKSSQPKTAAQDAKKAATSGLMNKFTKNAQGISETIKKHFERTFQNLLNDLIIFSNTNIIGFSCVLIFLSAARYYSKTFMLASMILLSATLYAITAYINQNWFFNILLDAHMGYWYPALIAGTCFRLYTNHLDGKLKQGLEENRDESIENAVDVIVDTLR